MGFVIGIGEVGPYYADVMGANHFYYRPEKCTFASE